MAQKEALKPLVTKSKARFFRKEGNYIYPLPSFVTLETVENPS